jgi:hypothetical protein
VIVEPDSSTTPEDTTVSRLLPLADGHLSAGELYQLTLYKWRYSLEAYGFNAYEVRDLMFLKWLYASKRVLP